MYIPITSPLVPPSCNLTVLTQNVTKSAGCCTSVRMCVFTQQNHKTASCCTCLTQNIRSSRKRCFHWNTCPQLNLYKYAVHQWNKEWGSTRPVPSQFVEDVKAISKLSCVRFSSSINRVCPQEARLTIYCSFRVKQTTQVTVADHLLSISTSFTGQWICLSNVT